MLRTFQCIGKRLHYIVVQSRAFFSILLMYQQGIGSEEAGKYVPSTGTWRALGLLLLAETSAGFI